jgi:hypothetical protein
MNNKNLSNEKETSRRIDHLVNLVDKHTRTERHLEQYSSISSPESLQKAKEIQQNRESEIENLKNLIAYGQHNNAPSEYESVQKRYEYAQGYLQNNKDHINNNDLQNLEEKQKHRQERLNEFK